MEHLQTLNGDQGDAKGVVLLGSSNRGMAKSLGILDLLHAPSRSGKTMMLHGLPVGTVHPFVVDAKVSIYVLSRRRAKRRLMQAGLAPAAAARAVQDAAAAGYLFAAAILKDAMRTGKRHAGHWFPFDTTIKQGPEE